MKILVANVGSTSFKYRLFAMDGQQERQLAKGGQERVSDHGAAIAASLEELVRSGALRDPTDLDAVGFKTVLGRHLSGCVDADDRVLEALEGFRAVAPAHNPPYAAAIEQFRCRYPHVARVALFETAFYQWMPEAATHYAVPPHWREAGVRRYGFHGASHKHVAERSAALLGRDDVAEIARRLYQQGHRDPTDRRPLRVVSCHLGGSSSVCGILNGRAIGASMGFSPQSGLPQNNRVGDLDSGALPYMMRTAHLSLEEAEAQLNKQGGLLGLSGVSNDLRDIRKAALEGHAQAQTALDVFVHSTRHWIGAMLVQMGGLDALTFTAGIGENNPWLREALCQGLDALGLTLDPARNNACLGTEADIASPASPARILVLPANEELVIARETWRHLQGRTP